MDFFATAAKGTEPALRDELIGLRIGHIRADRGGVHFSSTMEGAYKACLYSRIALKILMPLATFDAGSEQKLYDGVRSVDWSQHISPRHTLAVTAWCRDSALTHTNFVAQKVKDSVVDQQRDRHGSRSSVDRKDPDVPIFVHLVKNKATLYLDLSGESLHRRGYRRRTVEAPLKENLAAACLRLAGWDRKSTLADPMCGSGTIAIEAWLWSRNIAPGLSRNKFAFERWPSFDSSCRKYMEELRARARSEVLRQGPEIFASDKDHKAVMATEINARSAHAKILVDKLSVFDIKPMSPPGFILSNPPYGHRLEADRKFYQQLGQRLRTLSGHRVGLLLAKESMERDLGLKRDKFQIMFNGDIRFRLTMFTINHQKTRSRPRNSSAKKNRAHANRGKSTYTKKSPWDEMKRTGHQKRGKKS